MRNKNDVIRKMANICISVATLHVGTCSFGYGYYEPKISLELLKKSQKSNK